MSNYFVIEGTTLKKYTGNDAEVVVPEGVTKIDKFAFDIDVFKEHDRCIVSIVIPDSVTDIEESAFEGCFTCKKITIPEGITEIKDSTFQNCESLKSIAIPKGVTKIGDYAFSQCLKLESIEIPKGVTKIGNHAFFECRELDTIIIPEGVKKIGDCAFLGCVNLWDINLPSTIIKTDMEGNSAERYRKKPNWALSTINKLSSDIAKLIKMNWLSQMKPKDWAILYLTQNLKEFEELFNQYMTKKPDEYYAIMLDCLKERGEPEMFARAAEYAVEFSKELNPDAVCELYELAKTKNAESALEILEPIMNPKEIDKNSPYAFLYEKFDEPMFFKHYKEYGGLPEDLDNIKTADLSGTAPRIAVLAAIIPYMDIYAYKDWKGEDIEILPDSAQAAALLDYDSFMKFITSYLSKGKNSIWIIPFYFYNKETDQANPTTKAHAEKITQMRTDYLFEQFLSAKTWECSDWKPHFLEIDIDWRLAERLVWDQDGKTFTVSGRRTIDSEGNPVALTERSIKLAHPMEMDKKEVSAWQKYLVKNNIAQPFLQMWEPFVNPENIKEDRYGGIEIPIYLLEDQEKHGIEFSFWKLPDSLLEEMGMMDEDDNIDFVGDYIKSGYVSGEEIEIYLKGCNLDYEYIWTDMVDLMDRNTNNMIQLGSFTFYAYNRQVNHIVSLLDKWTFYERIKKDDMSVVDRMDNATAAQLADYTNIAIENNATNLTAKLLELKKERFPEFDGMEEFTLGE